ncbi:MAG: TetR/AcrR family transcriptional regulator C-terminal domain-containing protein [Thermoleophilia bacterium]|nr:TetR/AcrR family transcriptional regulator C-terminal domain-containing protein [Thermoleophilia bacterium]
MTPPRKMVSEERGKSRPGLTREAIIAAALEIVDEEGLEALSMRHLGSVLKVDPMAIYYHIPNKSALLDGLIEAVMGEIDLSLDDPSLPASERIVLAAHIYRDVMMAHPQAVQVIAINNLNTRESFRPVEYLMDIFLGAGFSPHRALAAVNIFGRFVRGFVLFEVHQIFAEEAAACHGCAPTESLQQLLPVEEFPRMNEVMASVGALGTVDEFDLGIRALVDGMFATFYEDEDQMSVNEDQT